MTLATDVEKPSPALTANELSPLRRLRPWRWAVVLAADWAMVVAAIAGAGWLDRWWAYLAALLLVGNRQHALLVLGHEGAHRLITRKRRLNDLLAQICFWPLFTDVNSYREFHFGHHRNLNTPDDPEMSYRRLGAPGWDVPRPRRQVALRFAADLVGLGASEMIRALRFNYPRGRQAAAVVALHTAFLAACAVAGTWWVAALWYGAAFTSLAAVWRFRCWFEHLGTDDTHRVHLTPLQSFLFAPHGISLHWEHHHWTGVPYFNLPALRRLTPGVPVMRLADLFRYYEACAPVASGTPTAGSAPAITATRRT